MIRLPWLLSHHWCCGFYWIYSGPPSWRGAIKWWGSTISTGKRENISDVENELELHEGDLLDLEALQLAELITSFMKHQSPLSHGLWRIPLAIIARMSMAR